MFDELCKARQENAGRKYVGPDGRNKAFSRNNFLDVAEELADAVNILNLLKARLTEDGFNDFVFPQGAGYTWEQDIKWMAGDLEEIGQVCLERMTYLPLAYRQETTDRSDNALPSSE